MVLEELEEHIFMLSIVINSLIQPMVEEETLVK
jgi:hypothetical protein